MIGNVPNDPKRVKIELDIIRMIYDLLNGNTVFSKGGYMEDIIILVDENGVEQEYEVLDTVEFDGDRYVVLIQEDDDEVSILKIESDEGDDLELVTCEDEVIEEVYQIFKENNTENFDFDD